MLINFICNILLQIDKLQTNHKGVFVVSDFKFKWLERYSLDDVESKQAAVRLLNFPCGIIRGAMANLGLQGIVNAELSNFPRCTSYQTETFVISM